MCNKFMTLGNECACCVRAGNCFNKNCPHIGLHFKGNNPTYPNISTPIAFVFKFFQVLTCFLQDFDVFMCLFKFSAPKKNVFKTPVFPHVSKCTSRMDPMGVKNGIKKQKEPDLVPESVTSSVVIWGWLLTQAISVEIVASPFSYKDSYPPRKN